MGLCYPFGMRMDFSKLSKYAFFAFVFLLPFQTVLLLREPMIGGAKWQYGMIGVYLTDLLLLIAIFSFVIASRLWEKNIDLRFTIFESEDASRRFLIPKSKIIFHKSTTMLSLLVFWSAVSILWAPDQVLSGYFFVKLLLGAGVFFIARSLGDREVRTVVRILIAAAVIQSLLGIWQFVTQSTFASTLLGMSHYEVWQAGTSVLKNDSGRWLRAYGSLPHPNMLGGFLAAALVLGISYLVSGINDKQAGAKNVIPSVVEGSRRKSKRFLDKLGMTMRELVIFVSLPIILLGLILAFSRTAWLGAILGIAVLLVTAYRERGRNGSGENAKNTVTDQKSQGYIILRPWNYVPLFRRVLVLGAATIVFVFVLQDQVFPRFDGTTIDREGSVEDRVQSLRDADPLIAAHPFLGVGAGNFTAAVMGEEKGGRGEMGISGVKGEMGTEKGPPDEKGSGTFFSEEKRYQTPRPIWTIQPAHNVFVLVFAELGIVGLFLFSAFLFSVFVIPFGRLWRFFGKNDDSRLTIDEKASWISVLQSKFFNQKSAILFALLPSLFLDHWLWSSHFGLFFFFLLAGFSARRIGGRFGQQ